jgi:hypothetical protein
MNFFLCLCEIGAVNVMDFNIGFIHVKDFESYEQVLQDVVQEYDGPFTRNIPHAYF